jgi:hypothetical protein
MLQAFELYNEAICVTNSPDRMQSMESHIRTSVPCREAEKETKINIYLLPYTGLGGMLFSY